jgi:hypothetical protein
MGRNLRTLRGRAKRADLTEPSGRIGQGEGLGPRTEKGGPEPAITMQVGTPSRRFPAGSGAGRCRALAVFASGSKLKVIMSQFFHL